MQPGKLDQLITLQRFTETSDGIGGVTRTWANFAAHPQIWANVRAKAGKEGMDEGRISATFTVLFTIHNRRDIEPTDRILWQGVPYNIRGIRDEGGRAMRLTIEAERGVNQ